jgi:RNA recognition motif-containing protein
MEIPWSDFIATPPSFASASQPYRTDYFDPTLQDFLISEEQVSTIFEATPAPFRAPQPMPAFAGPVSEFNEIENRTLLVSNLHPETTEEEIANAFNLFDRIRNIEYGQVVDYCEAKIEYFDLRHAQQVKRTAHNMTLHGSVISVVYAPLPKIEDPRKPPNNGTIVVFHLPPGLTPQQIESTFGEFGDIRQVRGTAGKPTQKFIEYWDIRAAERALDGLNQRYVMGSRVSIEFSLPGGFRRNVQRGDQPTPLRFQPS